MRAFLTIKEVAKTLRMQDESVRKLIRSKKLPGVRINRAVLIPRDIFLQHLMDASVGRKLTMDEAEKILVQAIGSTDTYLDEKSTPEGQP